MTFFLSLCDNKLIYKIVGIGAIVLFIPQFVAAKSKNLGIFKLGCGTYKAVGWFDLNHQQQFILTMNRGSFSSAELVVIGGDTEMKLKQTGTVSAIEFYVPKAITGTVGENIVFLRSISTGRTVELKLNPLLLYKEKCNLDEKYIN